MYYAISTEDISIETGMLYYTIMTKYLMGMCMRSIEDSIV